uniref:Laminin subunit alpha 3 n=1 Tax=Echeneis naucrates TaxID=173247 RepID=A0A665UIL9_ECHNA
MARGMTGAHLVAVVCIFSLTLFRDANGQDGFNDLTGFSLSPPYFNLAESSSISATATCGQDEAGTPRNDLYCKLVGGPNTGLSTQNIQGQFCDYCNAADPHKAHPVTNAIDGTEKWWQSPPLSRGPGYNVVNVTVDLGQLFHVAYILIKFANSPRPDLWVLERSVDNGRTFTPWQYFAHSKHECFEKFGKQPNARILNDDDQLCTTEYSRIVPLENGEIVVSLVNGRPGSNNFTYSPVLRDFTKATNIRLHFLRTSTLLGHLISKAQRDPTVTRRYYYSIKDISIGGRCVCHGHAQVCGGGRNPDNPNRLQCECQHNTCGESCDRCCPGFNQKPWRAATVSSPNECQPCQCFSHASDCYYDPEVERRGASLDTFGRYDGGGVCIHCQHNTAGVNCERCIEGFYRPYGVPPESPFGCIPCRCDEKTTAGCEMGSGRCICKPQFSGENCDRCADGYYYYPQCIRKFSFWVNVNFSESPSKCVCDYKGTVHGVCDSLGRCLCRQGVEGERCDHCRPGYHHFPNCQACQCSPEGSHGSICNPLSGQCLCLPGVVGQQCDRCASGLRFPQCSGNNRNKGTLCDRCKPLYWNLATENPHGCIECACNLKGTLSGVGECEQKSGQCHCKPNAYGHSCGTCQDGYFMLQKKNYFGCQGCQCDVGGAIGMACDEMSGRCQCRKNIVGRECNEPGANHYFPTLHQLKFEIEDGTTPNARPVRFGYNPQEFPDFSWRGYALMSPAQNEVRVTVHVDPREGRQDLFRVVLRFINPSSTSVTGSHQSKEIIFPPSRSPSFLTVPGEGFAEPFALTPGNWIIHIKGEGVLLDYLVLLPRDYYEAPLLQEKLTQPCTYLSNANRSNKTHFHSIKVASFQLCVHSCIHQPQLQLTLRVPHSGPYALVLEYASEMDTVQNVNILISGQLEGQIAARANIYSCAYSFLCRSVAVDSSNQVAALQLTHKTELLLQTSTASFLLYKVYAVPAEEFSIEYVEPKVLCVSTHALDGQLSSTSAVTPQQENEDLRWRRQTRLPGHDPQIDGVLLKFPQVSVVPLPGRYVVVLHYHQPEHTSFPVEVRVDAGHNWRGSVNASFCPAVSGCREAVIADGRIALDLDQNSWQPPSISVKVPPRNTLILVSAAYDEKPLDNSADFIQQCRGEGFNIDLRTSSQFCRDSARSLVAAYNDGAVACNCDKSGSTGSSCDPLGGQCACRQHVIGRQCTKCATGYYGFPYCRPCECGRRLCDEVTGQCICPPQTVKPACDVCQNQTFNYHPLLGCEGCECSPHGIKASAGPDCERVTGQCNCKPRIGGRQCDRCAEGYYRFPDCLPCNCNQGGVTPNVCHPDTGRCLCKKNVAGVRCDSCRDGSFYFDSSNPHGCTSCFCFGATDQCQSSSKRRGKFVDMRGWRLVRADQEEVPSVLNTASNEVVADIQELPPTVHTLHWVAPPSYLGDRVTSYGGFLTYQSKSFGIPSEGMTLLDRRPDVVLTGQDMTLIHMAPQVPLPDRLYQGRVQLVEGNWRHAITNRPVSREELMTVLAGLAGLRIQALYFTQTQRLSLGEVGLEGTTNTGTGGPGNTVEHCSCPPEYTGDSCEKCAPGFYRDSSGPYLGRCVPCECNGLADECEDRTGKCLNCKYSTAGDRCERCKEGYYGNAVLRTCRVCPCPFSVFAVGCTEASGDVQCICRSGYTGDRCDRCAPGYYGSPLTLGGSCKPCNCNGNGNNCDPRTGGQFDHFFNQILLSFPECDSCAQTLLHDLEKLDDEMGKIKTQLDNATASASSQDKLKTLEKAVSDTKVTCQCNVAILTCFDGHMSKHVTCSDNDQCFCLLCYEACTYSCPLFRQEYEKLAAKLDGAKTDLTKKVNDITKAAAKEDLVEAAEDHAKNLDKLAKELEDAHSIVIPMKFAGDGHVELRPPKDLEDLKAYTSLSLSLQRPDSEGGDMFVMYLGNRDSSKNYIGMYLKRNILYGVYKLNGVEYEMKSGAITMSASEPAKFDRVELSRIYQDAKIILTKDSTSSTPGESIKTDKVGNEKKNLLDISDIVFYVGGYPADFTPPASLNYPGYRGCIEFSSFNDKIVSLYNFQSAEKVNIESPCKRYVPPMDSDYFEGTGYGRVVIGKPYNVLLIGMSVFARSENGLLLYIGTEVNSAPCTCRLYKHTNRATICTNTTDWTDILIISTGRSFAVRAGRDTVAEIKHQYNNDFKEYYIGGAPQELREKYNINIQPFKGCLKNLKLNKDFKPIDEQFGISKGCPKDSLVWHKPLVGLLIDDEDEGQEQSGSTSIADTAGAVNIQTLKLLLLIILARPHFSLDVRTRSPEGLLFFAATRGERAHLALYLSKGRIRLSVGKQKEIFNREKYNDGKWHSVIFSLEKKKFRLVVDGIRAQDGQLSSTELTSMRQFISPLYLGSAKALPKQSVSGCIRNFKMNGAPMLNPTTNHGAGPCFEGQTQKGAYFSGNRAHVIISDFELLFNIRPRNPTGLLLHVGDFGRTQYGPMIGHYLSIYMLRGEVVVQVNNGKGEFMVSVKPKASLCDGMFHKVAVVMMIYMTKHIVQLHVDTVDSYKIGPPSSTITLTKDPLYVGGIPGECYMLPVTSSFVGCIQDMRINDDTVSFERLSSVFGPVNLKECPG